MRNASTSLMVLCLMCLTAGGCASKFTGEWLEEGRRTPDGEWKSSEGAPRLLALQFGPLSSVRVGAYLVQAQVVDEETVQPGQYMVFADPNKAQFGAMMAHLEDDHLIVTVGREVDRRLTKVHGKSIFPPVVRMPQLSRSNAPAADRYALAGP